MSAILLVRIAAVKTRAAILETVPGSGFHDNDRDANGEPRCPQKRLNVLRQDGGKLARLTDHVIPIYDSRQIHFVDDCACRVLATLQKYHAWIAGLAQGGDLDRGTDRKLLKLIPSLAMETKDGIPWLSFWRDDWNDVLHALHYEGIGLTGIPLTPDGTTP